MEDAKKLRSLAAWYRKFAEKAANPVIWEARLCTAEDLEAEATRLERRQSTVATPVTAPRPSRQLVARQPDHP